MTDREHRVREIAHRLWEDEGRPADQEKRHWATAERMFDAHERTSDAGSDAKRPHEETRTASQAGTSKRGTARKGAKRSPAGLQTSATH